MGDMKVEKVLRIDKWLWYARFLKSRTLASKFCELGRIRVNGNTVSKSHYLVRPFDVLSFSKGNNLWVIKILELGNCRRSAPNAQLLYEDISPPFHVRKESCVITNSIGRRALGSGRPTKIERRAVDRLMAKGDQWEGE
jgi:ribosome-associated heat shock protein Hsp15